MKKENSIVCGADLHNDDRVFLKKPGFGDSDGTGESTAETESMEIPQTPAETTVPSTIEEFPHEAEEPTVKPPEQKFEEGCRILLASDIHYLSRGLTDFGDGFKYKVEHGDGKVVNYIWEITDAFIEAVKKEDPDLVILSGDLTLNGERDSHLDFAKKLKEIEDAGIPVIVIREITTLIIRRRPSLQAHRPWERHISARTTSRRFTGISVTMKR